MAGAVGAIAALIFDATHLLALMYPGRERVEVTASDGGTVVYACKAGPAGEAPQQQALKAQAAFEENLELFADALVGGMMTSIEADEPALATGLNTHLKIESWAGSINLHLEREYGCALLG